MSDMSSVHSLRSLRSVHVELLNDPAGVLDYLLVGVGSLLREGLNDRANSHVLKRLAALLVDAEVADREEGNASRRLRRTLVIGDNVKKLLQGMVLDQIFAECVRVANEVSKSTGSVGPRLLLLILEELDKQCHAWPQMLVQHFIVEASIADCEACKLPRVTIWVSATLDSRGDQAVLEELLVEEAGVTAEVPNQVANLRPDASVFVLDQVLQVRIDVRIVDWIVEFLRDSG